MHLHQLPAVDCSQLLPQLFTTAAIYYRSYLLLQLFTTTAIYYHSYLLPQLFTTTAIYYCSYVLGVVFVSHEAERDTISLRVGGNIQQNCQPALAVNYQRFSLIASAHSYFYYSIFLDFTVSYFMNEAGLFFNQSMYIVTLMLVYKLQISKTLR